MQANQRPWWRKRRQSPTTAKVRTWRTAPRQACRLRISFSAKMRYTATLCHRLLQMPRLQACTPSRTQKKAQHDHAWEDKQSASPSLYLCPTLLKKTRVHQVNQGNNQPILTMQAWLVCATDSSATESSACCDRHLDLCCWPSLYKHMTPNT